MCYSYKVLLPFSFFFFVFFCVNLTENVNVIHFSAIITTLKDETWELNENELQASGLVPVPDLGHP